MRAALTTGIAVKRAVLWQLGSGDEMGQRLWHFGCESVAVAWKLDQFGRIDAQRMRKGGWCTDCLRENNKCEGNARTNREGASHRKRFRAVRL